MFGKASLTIVLAYRNNGKEDAKIQYPLNDVYYIDDVEKKKYHRVEIIIQTAEKAG